LIYFLHDSAKISTPDLSIFFSDYKNFLQYQIILYLIEKGYKIIDCYVPKVKNKDKFRRVLVQKE
jgi:hypothetical protein